MNNKTLFAVVARTAKGKEDLQADLNSILPDHFPDNEWWTHPHAGLAIHAPFAHPNDSFVVAASYVQNAKTSRQHIDTLLSGGFSNSWLTSIAKNSGQFAAFVWQDSELILLRDPLGQQAIYTLERDNYIYISNCMETLIKGQQLEMDDISAFHYLNYGSPKNGDTLIKNCKKVKAGHYQRIVPQDLTSETRYFTALSASGATISNKELAREVIETIDVAINDAICEDNPAILLSSGVDSGYVAQTIKDFHPSVKPTCYTIHYPEFPEMSESPFAAEFAKSLGFQHCAVNFTQNDLLESLQSSMEMAEPGSAATSLLHFRMLQEISSNGHQQIISGMGADEIFGGYMSFLHKYVGIMKEPFAQLSGNKLQQVLSDDEKAKRLLFTGVPRFFDDAAIDNYLSSPFDKWNPVQFHKAWYEEHLRIKPQAEIFELMIAHECQHRIPELLHTTYEDVNRKSQLATHYPFLAPRLIKQVSALGASSRFVANKDGWDNKIFWRKLVSLRLQEADRPRMAYIVPMLKWLEVPEFYESIWNIAFDSELRATGLLKDSAIEQLKAEVDQLMQHGVTDPDSLRPLEQMWALVTLSGWYSKWIK